MKILNVKIDAITRKEARLALNKPQIIFTPNPEILLEARKNKDFSRALKKGTLMLPDGHGLQFVSTLLKFRSKFVRALLYVPFLFLYLIVKWPFRREIPEVIHGSDFMMDVVTWAEKNGKSVFFLGGKKEVARKTAEYFERQFPRLKVAGYSNLDPSEAAFEKVKASGAKVVFVAYGAPKQELWIVRYHKQLPQVFHIMAVGGSFDFYSGDVRRAPALLRKLGLEWLWRLVLQPKARLRRIWNATVYFPLLSLFFDE